MTHSSGVEHVPRLALVSRWLLVGATTLAASIAVAAAGLPSQALLGALAVGIAYSLSAGRRPLQTPGWALTAAQTLLGVTIGGQLKSSTLQAILGDWAPIVLVSVATIVVSILAGLSLSRLTSVDRPTALLGMIAGGAEGIVVMADELDTDARLVAFMQYLRVLIVVIAAPVVATLLHHAPPGPRTTLPVTTPSAGIETDLAFTLSCCVAGAGIAHRLAFPASALLTALVLTAGISVTGLAGTAQVPEALQQLTFAVIGLQVGLRFTAAAIRRASRLLPVLLATIAAILAACAGLGALLAALTGETFSDAYLATTPGGLAAVLAAALAGGGNASFVLAVQTLRLLAMLLVARPVVRMLGTRRRSC